MVPVQHTLTVLGGGTGIFPVVAALRHLHVDIRTVITVADSGGSAGRIRDEFGFQPVGDLRQSLAALAETEGEEWIRKILLYRFNKGSGLKGHNLGNLILTALQDMTGDTTQALEIAEKVFRLEGSVIPVTRDNVQMEITYVDGSTVVGEDILDQPVKNPKKIDHIALIPKATLNPMARTSIEESDMIVIGPGDYYGSLMPTLLPKGVKAAFTNAKGKVVYILNLMTRLTQTEGMTAADHVAGIEAVIGRPIDLILVNKQPIGERALALYAKEGEFPVEDNLGNDPRVLRKALLHDALIEKKANDTAHRSLLRHDSAKLKAIFNELLNK